VRILLVGDLHYTMPQLDWVLDQAGDFDLVVLAGDHLDVTSAVPLEAQVPVILAYLDRLSQRTQVAACSGNHDLTASDGADEKAAPWLATARQDHVVTDRGTIEMDGHVLTVVPWWDGPHGRAAVEELLATEADGARDRWVWVYHWPPADAAVSLSGRGPYGDADLTGWIERYEPALVLTGHVHEAPFVAGGSWASTVGRTTVLNAGRQIGPVPSHVIVDLDAGVATWRSYDGSEEVILTGRRERADPDGRAQ
jgi:Icc-related predicted phosphoesterase